MDVNPVPAANAFLQYFFPFVAPSGNAQNGWFDGWFSPTITLNAAGDPATELTLVNGVMSYGRQIGIVMDALAVVQKHIDRSTLTDREKEALERLDAAKTAIDAVKALRKRKSGRTS
ncbi:hypothetical protein [Magnetospirillum fulvum]|uniref:Uncharacterized protein n=1 Tax=Magnetospirillum fulvum TaxID=1082 RepID=A0A1H6IL21_MAGFU|nr:hypothetical protein [Magnetospirillum fulvum]SEH49662.1 hypothetical protein SAMN04244559_02635 [Magnetospirillum fulvum]